MTKEQANKCREKGTEVWLYDVAAKEVRSGTVSMCCAIQSNDNMFDVHVGEFYYFTKNASGLFFTKLECLEAEFAKSYLTCDRLSPTYDNSKEALDKYFLIEKAVMKELKGQLYIRTRTYADRFLKKKPERTSTLVRELPRLGNARTYLFKLSGPYEHRVPCEHPCPPPPMQYDEHTWGMDITVGWYVVVTDYGKQDHHRAVTISVFLTNEYGNLIVPTPIWVTNNPETSIYNAMTEIGYPVVEDKRSNGK